MRKIDATIVWLFGCFFLWGVPDTLTAQNQKNTDSLLSVSALYIYGEPDRTIEIGKNIYKDSTHTIQQRIRALLLISDAYSSKRDYQNSMDYFSKAVRLTEKETDPSLKIRILNKAGVKYQQLRIYDKAIKSLDEAFELLSEIPLTEEDRFDLATNYIVRGLVYKEQLSCDVAISYFDKGIRELNRSNIKLANAHLSITTYNKGNCFIMLKDFQKAQESFMESIQYAEVEDNNSLKSFAMKGLAEVFMLEGNHDKAISVLQEALKVSEGVGDLILNRALYRGLAENYLAVDNWKMYQKHHEKFKEIESQIKLSERSSISDSIEELIHNRETLTTNAKNTYKLYLFLGIFLFLGTMGIVIKRIFNKQKVIKKLSGIIQKLREEREKSSAL